MVHRYGLTIEIRSLKNKCWSTTLTCSTIIYKKKHVSFRKTVIIICRFPTILIQAVANINAEQKKNHSRYLVGRRVAAFVQRAVEHFRVGQVFEQLTLDVAVMHVPGRRLAGHSDQEMSHLGRQVAQCENGQHVRLVQETQFFDVGMHGDDFR